MVIISALTSNKNKKKKSPNSGKHQHVYSDEGSSVDSSCYRAGGESKHLEKWTADEVIKWLEEILESEELDFKVECCLQW
eukprot:1395220-Amorphochlora_amoeboformis.AAC.1